MTISFYNEFGEQFFQQTVALDMSHIYSPFLERIPKGGRILDAGCGSGRDSKAFADKGYSVIAFDASATMVRLASEYTGLPVIQLRFDEISFDTEFDGVWACASLLHVPISELKDVFERLIAAMKIQGICYVSFKSGEGERTKTDGRLFTDFDTLSFKAYIQQFKNVQIEYVWQTTDSRPEKSKDFWLNAILRRTY